MRAIACALTLLAAATSNGWAQESTGKFYLPLCRAVLSAQFDPLGSMCLGFAHAARTYLRDAPPPHRACVPSATPNADVVKVIITHLQRNSRRLHDNFALLTAEALSAAWPCK